MDLGQDVMKTNEKGSLLVLDAIIMMMIINEIIFQPKGIEN